MGSKLTGSTVVGEVGSSGSDDGAIESVVVLVVCILLCVYHHLTFAYHHLTFAYHHLTFAYHHLTPHVSCNR
jgi:hypothetical protein